MCFMCDSSVHVDCANAVTKKAFEGEAFEPAVLFCAPPRRANLFWKTVTKRNNDGFPPGNDGMMLADVLHQVSGFSLC